MPPKKIEDIPGTKAHTQYYLKNGKRVPGGSFVAEVAASWQGKKYLMNWVRDLAFAGHDHEKYVDALAAVGTVCHGMIENFFLGRDNQELFHRFSPWAVDSAKKCFAKFEEWADHFDFEPILFEQPFISEVYKFGGTPDFFGKIRHKIGIVCTNKKCIVKGNDWWSILLDWKTSKHLYKKHLYQVAGYSTLLYENGYEAQLVGLLRIGRNEAEGFQFIQRTSREILLQWEIFRVALQMLALQNEEPKWLS